LVTNLGISNRSTQENTVAKINDRQAQVLEIVKKAGKRGTTRETVQDTLNAYPGPMARCLTGLVGREMLTQVGAKYVITVAGKAALHQYAA
jgi:hypothetical protein